MDIFGSMLSAEEKAAHGLDVYLDRMQKILNIKKMAIETGEDKVSESMDGVFYKSVELATKEINKLLEEYKKENEKVKSNE